jgi:AdoMet-dependent heme synthase
VHHVAHDYTLRPLLLFWEMTRACPLACAHCRAFAQACAAPDELTPAEGARFLEDVAGFGSPSPILVMTGGDPLSRPDLFERLAQARAQGTKVALAPAVSPALLSAIPRLRDHGVRAISISLDGATRETHEGIRRVAGHFEQTIAMLAALVEAGFMVQVNTTVMRRNVEELASVAALLQRLGVHVWEVFYLVHVGRGRSLDELGPRECEDVGHMLYDAARYGFVVRTVEAPFFRRIATERAERGHDVEAVGTGPLYARLRDRLRQELGAPTTRPKATSAGTRDGNGILFVAQNGDITPAGFLPLALGNVKTNDVVDVYRTNPTLVAIREARFGGRCGSCAFGKVCGGSRSRAFASTGDPLAEDPACVLTLG